MARSTPDNASVNVTPVADITEGTPIQDEGYKWTALSITTVGALLASIQGSALLIALPNILADLHATFFTIMWILIGYLLIITVLTPVIGRLADIYGRKRLYNAGFIMFGVGSLVAGLAQPQFQGGDLIVGRIIQGVGGALLMTNSTAIVTDAFRKGQVGFGLGYQPDCGCGGFLARSDYWWSVNRMVLALGVSIQCAALYLWSVVGYLASARASEPNNRQHIDWIGSVTLTIGLTGALLALSLFAFPLLGQITNYIILALGILGLVVFGIIEPRIKEPIVQLRLFKDRLFTMANLSGLLMVLPVGWCYSC